MKRVFALVFMLLMIMSLAACGKDAKPSASAPSSTGTGETTGTTEPNGEHVHELGDWKIHIQPSNFAPGESRKTCSGCDFYESKKLYNQMFYFYANVARELGGFNGENKPGLDEIISAALINGVENASVQGDLATTYTVKVADMDAFTTKCLGYTCDYTGIKNLPVLWEAYCDYDAGTNSLVITAYPAGGGDESTMDDVTFTTEDEIHFVVTVTYINFEGDPWYATLNVELVGENYIIKEHIW